MSELKRDKIKYIRDRAKSAYVKDEECTSVVETSLWTFITF